MFGNLFNQKVIGEESGASVSGSMSDGQNNMNFQSSMQSPMQPVNQGGTFQQNPQYGLPMQNGQMPMQQVPMQQMPQGQQYPNNQQMPQQNGQSSVVDGTNLNPEMRQNMSVLSHLDARTSQVLVQAQREAVRIHQPTIEPIQLLYGLLFDAEVFQLLSEFSVDATKLSNEIQSKEPMGQGMVQPTLSQASQHIFEQAYAMSKGRNVDFITPEDVLITLFAEAQSAQLLQSQGLDRAKLEEKMEKSPEFTTGKKSVLQKFGTDLTDAARAGQLDPITGREREVDRLVHVLLRRTKNNPVIIGEAGTGKTAIVEGLAQKIVEGSAPKDLLNKQIIQLDIASLVAGASHRGEFEERLRQVIKETMAASGKIILFIDEIHTLIGAGDNGGALDASNIVKPYLARGQLQLIGTTTTAEYRKYFEKDKAFERRFQPVLCEEPDEDTAETMLGVLKGKYEKFHSVVMPPEALKAAVHLSKRYVGERFLPDKAVDLLDEAAAEVKLAQQQGRRQDNTVSEADIQKVVSSWTGIPITKLTENESEKLLHLEDFIHKRLIGQDNAVAAVAEAVRRGRIGLASANRPIASFIFLGPTGTGKTELAKTLAEILFGKDDAMIRLDMSEYMEKHEVAKLIGAPPGYVGYEEGGQLTEAVRAKPYSVVLLDEIEKAHPDVFNILLQLLEDGRLTDNKGNTISFKNTIIIATSNIGSQLIQEKLIAKQDQKSASAIPPQVSMQQPQSQTNGIGANQAEDMDKAKTFAELSSAVTGELRKFFRPELLNRFDEIIIFEPLARKNMMAIAKLGIDKTRKLLVDQQVDLTITDAGLEQLAKEGYDPLYGARPLRRLIQTSIENPVAVLLINKTFVAGDTILIDYDSQKQQFVFTKTQKTPQEQVVQQAAQQLQNGQDQQNGQISQEQPQPGVQSQYQNLPQGEQQLPQNNMPQQPMDQNSGLFTPAQPTNGYTNDASQQTVMPPADGTNLQPVG